MFSGVYCNEFVCPSVCPSVQNTTFFQGASGSIESHSVTALVPKDET